MANNCRKIAENRPARLSRLFACAAHCSVLTLIRMLTEKQLRKILREECRKAGSQKAWAEARDISGGYVGDVLHGRREPGEKVLAALGYRRVVGDEETNAKERP